MAGSDSWVPDTGVPERVARGQNLSGVFVDTEGRLVLGWPNADYPGDGCAHCCCFHSVFSLCCPCCIPCVCVDTFNAGMEHLALEPLEDRLMKATHMKDRSWRGNWGCCGQEPKRRELTIARAELENKEGTLKLRFFRSGKEDQAAVTVDFSHFFADEATTTGSCTTLVPEDPSVKVNAANGALAAVEAVQGGEGLPGQHAASSSVFGWRSVTREAFQSWWRAASTEQATPPEPGTVAVASPRDIEESDPFAICFMAICCTLCLPLIFEDIALHRQRVFALKPKGGNWVSDDGGNVQLDVYEAPRHAGKCAMGCCLRLRGPTAPRMRGGFGVAKVEAKGNQLLVFTSHLTVFSMRMADAAAAEAACTKLNGFLDEHGRTAFGVPRCAPSKAPSQMSMSSLKRGSSSAALGSLGTSSLARTFSGSSKVVAATVLGVVSGRKEHNNNAATEEATESNAVSNVVEFDASDNDANALGEAEALKKLTNSLSMSFSTKEVEDSVATFAASRGSGVPSPEQLAAAFGAASSIRHSALATALRVQCGGPFLSGLVAAAVQAASSRMRAENLAEAMSPHIADPGAFESVVIEGTQLRDASTFKKKRILELLPPEV